MKTARCLVVIALALTMAPAAPGGAIAVLTRNPDHAGVVARLGFVP